MRFSHVHGLVALRETCACSVFGIGRVKGQTEDRTPNLIHSVGDLVGHKDNTVDYFM